MITAAVAPVIASSNHEAAWATVFALLTVFAICAVLYQHERRADRHEAVTNEHDEQLATLAYQMPALLEFLGIEIPAPTEDDSPEAMAADETPTEEFPVCPPTIPDGIPLQVQSALLEQRPSPVPRKSADWVEDAIKGFNFSGRDR